MNWGKGFDNVRYTTGRIKRGLSNNIVQILTGIIMFNVLVILSTFILGKSGVSKAQTYKEVSAIDQEMYETEEQGTIHSNESKKQSSSFNIPEKVKVFLKEEKKVVTLDLEEYVIGVVSAEMPASFEVEALKAQAVAARTYAVAHCKTVSGKGCSLNNEADLCDTVHCQVYMNKETRMNKWNEKNEEALYSKIVEAVNSTKGEILTYNGQLVMHPYYFSTSSGNTENAMEVFGVDEPYLKSVPSQGEEQAYKYKTEFTFTKYEVLKTIKDKYRDLNLKSTDINENSIVINSRTDQGTVKKLSIGNITMTGAEFRTLLKLTSANFNISYNGDNMVISCKGYGHGVGMSQWGAGIMAKEGYGYREILKHYYTGVNIN